MQKIQDLTWVPLKPDDENFKLFVSVAGIALCLLMTCLLTCCYKLWERQILKKLPEAEVKIHLAILALEHKQAEKIAKNEYQIYQKIRE